jgi:PPOX class probable F420-dependent enzyme
MIDIANQLPASHHDLLDRPVVAALTTIDAQGRPQSTAVWFLHEDGVLRSSITKERQKWRNLASNPHCSLLIIDPDNPQRTIEVRAEAELEADPDYVAVGRIATQYGADPDQFRAMGGERYTVTYRAWRVVTNPRS